MTLPTTLRPPVRPSSDCSLDRLIVELEGRFAEGGPGLGKDIAELLAAYAQKEESWRPYVLFREDTYSRNLVWRTESFELLLLAWNRGQESPIHDHAGQQCWMAVLEGELEEIHYAAAPSPPRATPAEGDSSPTDRTPGAEAPAAETPATPTPRRTKSFSAGAVAYIHDDIALHLIRPAAETRGISLHLYARPIDSCRTFCPDTGAISNVEVGYHSVRGNPCAQIEADTIRAAWTPPS